MSLEFLKIIKYIPLQQGLRLHSLDDLLILVIIKYIPLQQGLRLCAFCSPISVISNY